MLAHGRLQICGKEICQKAFRVLLGIGTGRFRKLRAAALKKDSVPLDQRFQKRNFLASNKESCRKRECIVEFLEELYQTAAEPLPNLDSKPSGSSEQQARSAAEKFEDRRPEGRKQLFRRHRGRRPKLFLERAKLKREHTPTKTSVMRNLPPGTFTDYWNLLRSKLATSPPDAGGVRSVSLKLFCKAGLFMMQQDLNSCVQHKIQSVDFA